MEDPHPMFASISGSASFNRAGGAIRLSTHTAPEVTVLMIDIKGFTAQCAALPAAAVGAWVAAFYSRVDSVAAAHGVRKLESRGDCCVCVAGTDAAVLAPAPRPRPGAPPDSRGDQATRTLAFAAALHANLATLAAADGASPAATAVRMGAATGPAAFLVRDAAAGAAAAPFASVRGEAVDLAAHMEALSAPGAVHVHRSTADRWAAETRRPPPPLACFERAEGGPLRAAVFDCVAGVFRAIDPAPPPPPPPPPPPAGAPAWAGAAARLGGGGPVAGPGCLGRHIKASASAMF
jgi:class 3 adenylate cyclase